MKNYFCRLYLNTEYDDDVLDEIVEYSRYNDDLIHDEDVAHYENNIFDMETELIGENTEFPTKDRTTRAENRKLRRRHIRSRKGKYASLMGTDCPKAGKLAKGKEIYHRSRAYKWLRDGESMDQYRVECSAREAMRDFYKSEGNRVYGYDEDDWDDEYEYEEDYDDTRYEDELFEEEKAEIFRRINEVKTIADAIYLSADFAREAAFHEEYGIHEWGDLYKYGISVLATEMSRREWEQYY